MDEWRKRSGRERKRKKEDGSTVIWPRYKCTFIGVYAGIQVPIDITYKNSTFHPFLFRRAVTHSSILCYRPISVFHQQPTRKEFGILFNFPIERRYESFYANGRSFYPYPPLPPLPHFFSMFKKTSRFLFEHRRSCTRIAMEKNEI